MGGVDFDHPPLDALSPGFCGEYPGMIWIPA